MMDMRIKGGEHNAIFFSPKNLPLLVVQNMVTTPIRPYYNSQKSYAQSRMGKSCDPSN
jgi:hypothetical protein